jgi:Na+-driven multidrug efflux pump
MLVLVAQAAAGLIETFFIGKLGTDALAGVALVFPVVMLMQMMSAGAMGGGIASSIARALGAGRRADADALALHALVDYPFQRLGVSIWVILLAAVLLSRHKRIHQRSDTGVRIVGDPGTSHTLESKA